MAGPGFDKKFTLDGGILPPGSSAFVTIDGGTDANALLAIAKNGPFPAGDIQLGHIKLAADTGKGIAFNAGSATVTFNASGSVQAGIGIYDKPADAVKALKLVDAAVLQVSGAAADRFLLMQWGYDTKVSARGSHPVGVLGSVSFGVEAARDAVYAVLHRFDGGAGAQGVIEDTVKSWRLPRHVAFAGGDANIAPSTWVIAEADGSFAMKLAASLGWDMSFARDLKVLGVTHNLSAKLDASLKATFGFSVAGKYLVIVGRETATPVVRLQLSKQSKKGLDFGFNLSVGIKGADPQLPENFDDFIKGQFGVHGLQVLKDLRGWTDPSVDLGKKLAGLAVQTALDLLKSTTGIDPAAEFDKAKKIVGDALNTWTSLPDKLSSMLWDFLGKEAGAGVVADFKTFLADLADPAKGADTLAKALQKATFGDTPQGQFLEAVAEKGLLALAQDLGPASEAARKVLDLLNGGIIAKLQAFINERLHLDQIRKAVSEADFKKIDQWLQDRLSNFLDKTVGLAELKDVQTAITTLDKKVGGYYKTAVQALTKRYSIDFAATYQKATTDTALLDVSFDLSKVEAMKLFAEVAADSNLDRLLIEEVPGVTLKQAHLTHEIQRKSTVELHMPFFDFNSTHVNLAFTNLDASEDGGRVLIYETKGDDKVVVKNRCLSELSVLATLRVAAGGIPQIEGGGTISYEMRQVKKDMRPADLTSRTSPFIHTYLNGLFKGDDASLDTFYIDLDNALTTATGSQSNHLGDVAVSMQLSLPATVLSGWFAPRSASQLRADQMNLSRRLQKLWRDTLPALYFADLGKFDTGDGVAALLVWSSLPVTTNIGFNDPVITQFDKDDKVLWDVFDVDKRRAMVNHPRTFATLASKLTVIHQQLLAAGSGMAGFFAPSQASIVLQTARSAQAEFLTDKLLSAELDIVEGATGALKDIGAAFNDAATAPTKAKARLTDFVAGITDTFNKQVRSNYTGMPARLVGPMMLTEASGALGSMGAKPAAMLKLYALKPGHTFDLGTFIEGTLPPEKEVALTQTLVAV